MNVFQRLEIIPALAQSVHNFWLYLGTNHNLLHGLGFQAINSNAVIEDNLSSMIYLSSNGLSGPKRT